MDKIKLADVLKEMRTIVDGKRTMFDLTYRTFNQYNKMGGEFKEYKRCRLVMRNGKKSDLERLKVQKKTKNPNHWDNKTRNIELLNGDVKTIHFKYIITFNGLNVIY